MDQMIIDGAPIPGKVFLRIGPLLVRRGKWYPDVICYFWRGREIISSAKWYVIFNAGGTRALIIAFLNWGEGKGREFSVVHDGRPLFQVLLRRGLKG